MGKMTKRSATIAAAATAVAVIGAGVAYATWSNSVNVSTSAKAGKMEPVTVTAAVPVALLPGRKSDLQITVTNPNNFPVLVKGITIGTITNDKNNCPSNSVSATGDAIPSGLLIDAKTPAGNGSTMVVYPQALQMAVGTPNECQDATYSFSTTVLAELQSAA